MPLTMTNTWVERSLARYSRVVLPIRYLQNVRDILLDANCSYTIPLGLSTVMSTRFRHREWDGDKSNLSSALEAAIDQHWYVIHIISLFDYLYLHPLSSIFLSSTEAQYGRL